MALEVLIHLASMNIDQQYHSIRSVTCANSLVMLTCPVLVSAQDESESADFEKNALELFLGKEDIHPDSALFNNLERLVGVRGMKSTRASVRTDAAQAALNLTSYPKADSWNRCSIASVFAGSGVPDTIRGRFGLSYSVSKQRGPLDTG